MLSYDSVFEIQNRWDVVVEINDTLYVDNAEYEVEGDNAFFSAAGILNIMIDNNISDRKFRFTNCTTSTRNCSYSQYFEVIDVETTDDDLSYVQYYLSDTNVNAIKKTIKENYTPRIAIIDDGVNILHEELQGQTWVNTGEVNGNRVDDDGNGYVDDYYGWNFVDNNNSMTPKWSHGTNVAWVIGAINNNDIWIAGILSDVEIMPIIACRSEWCSWEDIESSIQYAVDNWADIINMSLWGEWFSYTDWLDEVIDYASSKWVILVIAAGNGDTLGTWKWVNTSINKVSPVCWWTQDYTVIWVSSNSIFSDLTRNWLLSSWSNFWACIDISTYWESIVSINTDGGYDTNNGTSFSAPIITWIIWLGFAQYGKQDPELIHTSILASVNTWHGVDASRYMDSLSSGIRAVERIEAERQQQIAAEQARIIQERIAAETAINKYIPILRNRIWDRLEAIPVATLQSLVIRINRYLIRDIPEDFTLKLEALKYLIEESLSGRSS